MNRRDFLYQLSFLTGGTTVAMSGIPLRAFAHPLVPDAVTADGKIIVLLQLNGGNDGLNTVIPFRNDIYYQKRPTIAIRRENAISLNDDMGLHPSMRLLKNLYDKGQVSIVQNVGYDNPNRSHFRSTDIWLSGSDATEFLYEGWTGRYLAHAFPEFPGKFPEHPMAIQLGAVESMLLQSQWGSMGVVFDSPNAFYQLVSGSRADSDPPPPTIAGEELRFLKGIAAQSIQYAGVIKAAADKAQNQVTYPNTNVGRQLAIIAELIGGGLQTSVYLATLGGFDTHAGQLPLHANLLTQFSEAVAAFQADLEKLGVAEKVVLMTFSEFGRRLNENGSAGTDHGTAAPLFVIGKGVRGGLYGDAPVLNDLDNVGDIKFRYDYRQIYAAVLRDHLGLTDADMKKVLEQRDFNALPIFKRNTPPLAADVMFELYTNAPNPFTESTTIGYKLAKSMDIRLRVYDLQGHVITVLHEGLQDAGMHEVRMDRSGLAAGIYLCALEAEGQRAVKKMLAL